MTTPVIVPTMADQGIRHTPIFGNINPMAKPSKPAAAHELIRRTNCDSNILDSPTP